MSRLYPAILLLIVLMLPGLGRAGVGCGVEGDWPLYRGRFVSPDGRVVDTGNGAISHSEGQGYGMLLAAAANDRPAFEAIWSWTARVLGIRDDGLFAWKWDPAQGAVTDRNNATDGDLLIAWALLRAGHRWNAPAFVDAARAILRSVRSLLVRPAGGYVVLLPGADGFNENGAVVVNLSYWLFPALADFADADPSPHWAALAVDGRRLITAARFGVPRLPPDWLSIRRDGTLRPAAGFPAEFGYNAIRVPLHIAWAGRDYAGLLPPFAAYWGARGGTDGATMYDLEDDRPTGAPAGPGAQAIAGLVVARAAGRRPTLPHMPADADYYAASLVLLSRLACQEGS